MVQVMVQVNAQSIFQNTAQSRAQGENNEAKGDVIVVGEALLDIFPSRTVVGGAPFNVACSMAALGADVCLITRLGNDANGDLVRAGAARFGVELNGLQTDSARPTGTVQVRVTATENHFSIADDQAWDYLDLQPALDAIEGQRAKFLYFGTLAQRSKQSRDTIRYLADRFGSQFGGRVYLDLNLREMPDIRAICEESLALADILKVNEEELRTLLEWFGESSAAPLPWRSENFRAAVTALIKKFALTCLIVTRGAKGYAYFDVHGSLQIEGDAVKNVAVADTVGAGDSFSAMFLASQVQGLSLDESLARASELAAAICGIDGAVPPSRDFYARWCPPEEGHASADDVKNAAGQPERQTHG